MSPLRLFGERFRQHKLEEAYVRENMPELPTKSLWDRLNNSALIRFLLMFASGWALIQVLEYFETVIFIFTFAAIIAFLLSYPVHWLRRYLPRSLAVAIVFFIGMAIIVGLTITVGLTVISQGQQLVNSLTDFFKSLIPLVDQLEKFLQSRNIQINLNSLREEVPNQLIAGLGSGIGYSLATLQAFLFNFVNFILVAVIAFFMLLDGKQLWFFIMRFFPKNLQPRLTTLIRQKFLGFFRGQMILCLFLTTATFIVFLVLNVPFPLLLALVAGICDIIPGIGATLGVGAIFLVVLSQSIWLALEVLVACIILQQVQDNLIAPRVMRDSLNINPVVVFFALLVGAKIAGLLGVFIAIPITGVMVSLFEIDEMKAE